jgi:hypothetical protein
MRRPPDAPATPEGATSQTIAPEGLVCRREMLSAQVEARRQAEMARWAARFPVPAGVPAVEGLSAVEQVMLAGEGVGPQTVFTELLDDELRHVKGGR